MTKTLKVRVRDKHKAELERQSKSVNYVWSYINELSSRFIRERGKFLSAFDIHPYTKGANKELGLHSQTLQCVAKEYVVRRKQFKKSRLSWRKSGGAKRSLGWVPVNTGAAKWKNGQVYFNGKHYKIWDSYGLSQYKFKTASFSEDARYAGIVFEEINESYTTQTCSSCGDIPDSSPKGRAGLRIREWSCSSCYHDGLV